METSNATDVQAGAFCFAPRPRDQNWYIDPNVAPHDFAPQSGEPGAAVRAELLA